MWNAETHYTLKLKNSLIQNFLQESYEHNDTIFDLDLVTKENRIIRAHKIILALASELFYNLLENNDNIQTIMLPDFKFQTVEILLQLLYTGETFIHPNLKAEFVELCNQLKVKIPGISHLASQRLEDADQEEIPVTINSTPTIIPEYDCQEYKHEEPINLETETDRSVDDYPFQPELFVENDDDADDDDSSNAEKILSKAAHEVLIEGKTIVETGRKYGIPKTTLHRRITKIKSGVTDTIKRKYYPKHTSRNRCALNDKNKSASPFADPKINYNQRLRNAAQDVINNKMTYQNAALKHGIPRSVIFRRVKKLKEECGTDNPSFPFLSHEPDSDASSRLSLNSSNTHQSTSLAMNPETNFHEAIEAVKTKIFNILEASQKFGVPQSILHSFTDEPDNDVEETIKNRDHLNLNNELEVKQEYNNSGLYGVADQMPNDRFSVF